MSDDRQRAAPNPQRTSTHMSKLSPHPLFMLKMFEKGWGFKMFNSKRGSWMTYWSLRTRGLIGNGPTVHRAGNLVAVDRLTDKGRAVLAKLKEKGK
jgi:hypothetical protein